MLVALAAIVGFCVMSVAFTMVDFRNRVVPNIFHCCRCERDFTRNPERGFPRNCPHCGAGDWSV